MVFNRKQKIAHQIVFLELVTREGLSWIPEHKAVIRKTLRQAPGQPDGVNLVDCQVSSPTSLHWKMEG